MRLDSNMFDTFAVFARLTLFMHRFAPIALIAFVAACQTEHQVETESTVDVKPIRVETVHEVKPIYVQVDVNVRVERELEDFFGDLDQSSSVLNPDTPSP